MLSVLARATGSPADPQHVAELIAAFAAQTDPAWQLTLVARGRRECTRWRAIVADEAAGVTDRVRVERRGWRARPGRAGELVLRVDDVPLPHLVETVRPFLSGVRLQVVVQDARRVRWPSGVMGWTLLGAPSLASDDEQVVVGGRTAAATPDPVLLRRRWIR
ncbi:MAG TPA: hypothetical protein VGH01_02935 [Jatrophihabitantaceae bacterium]